jgi:hypothetical protein
MKSHLEAIRSLMYYGAFLVEKQHTAETDEMKIYHGELLDLLTPVIKAYCTDKAVEICSESIQIFGGYGYTQDYPVEQIFRDARIAPIYEGTNGIQAIDLLARKLGMKKGMVFMNLINEINATIARAREMTPLVPLADSLEKTVNTLSETAMYLGQTAMSAEFKTAFAHATPFLAVVGDVIAGWMLLWRATAASPALEKIVGSKQGKDRETLILKNKDAAFYQGQLKTAEFFIQSILPITQGRMASVKAGNSAVVDIPEPSFGA